MARTAIIESAARGLARVMGAAAILGLQILGCFVALALWAALALSANAAERLSVPFEVAWGPMVLGEGRLNLKTAANTYTIDGQGRTMGAARIVRAWSTGITVRGDLGPAGRMSRFYQAASTMAEEQRVTRVRYDEGRSVGTEIVPPLPETEPRTPVDPFEVHQVNDAFTAFANMLDRVAKTDGAFCDHQERVWDGVRLYEVVAATIGPGAAPADRPWAYAGPTLVCGISLLRHGGFPPPRANAPPPAETRRVVHFAEVSGRWMPVRVEVTGRLGLVVLRVRMPEVEMVASTK